MLLTNKLGYKRSYKHRNKHMPPKANQRHFGQRPWMLEMYATNCSLNIYEDTFCQTSDLLHKPPHYTYFWHSKVSNTKVENRSTHGVETDASAYLSLASCNLLTAKVDCFVLFAPWTTCTNWDQNRFISFSTYHAHKLGNRRTDACEDGQINMPPPASVKSKHSFSSRDLPNIAARARSCTRRARTSVHLYSDDKGVRISLSTKLKHTDTHTLTHTVVIIVPSLHHEQFTAPIIASSLHIGWFQATLTTSVNVRLCNLRSSRTIFIHLIWERPCSLFQASGGNAVKSFLTSTPRSIRAMCPNRKKWTERYIKTYSLHRTMWRHLNTILADSKR